MPNAQPPVRSAWRYKRFHCPTASPVMRHLEALEAALDGSDHQVTYHFAGDAASATADHYLPVAGAMTKTKTIEPLGRGSRDDLNISGYWIAGPQSRVLLKGEPVPLHDPKNPLGIDGRLALFAPLAAQMQAMVLMGYRLSGLLHDSKATSVF